jgi:NAD(P)-dependent dehydrogenase (short-subunit alcohol dehydrogenase family)
MKSVVVTGVSTGIGKAVLELFVGKGYRVFGSVRKPADAERLQAEFGDAFAPLVFDVTDEAGIHAAAKQVRQMLAGETLFGLVNNAGVAVPGPLLYIPIENFRKQIEINLTGQLMVIQAFTPLLGADARLSGAPGRIVNISSISGKNGSPFVGAYAASKHALEGMSESLRRELMIFGIDVVLVAPGPIATPIWDKADETDAELYNETEYFESGKKFRRYAVQSGRKGLPARTVAEVVLEALTTKRPRVRYAINPNPFMSWAMSMLPKRLLDGLIADQLGLRKSAPKGK